VLQREGARPFANGIRDRHLAGERVAHKHVVGVGPVVHEIHEYGITRQRRERSAILVLDRDLVQKVEHPLRDAIADVVVGDDVEERNDLVDVFLHAAPCGGFRYSSLASVRSNRLGDGRIRDQPFAHRLSAGELEPIHARPKMEQCATSRPAGVPTSCRDHEDEKSAQSNPEDHAGTMPGHMRRVKTQRHSCLSRTGVYYQNTPSPSRRSMFIHEFVEATPQCAGLSDLRRLFAYDTARSTHLLQFTQAVMRAPGPMTPGERELIAAMTSQVNHCPF
jgi:hypothetical protein